LEILIAETAIIVAIIAVIAIAIYIIVAILEIVAVGIERSVTAFKSVTTEMFNDAMR
jgi:hypothetical protein